jgi:hypothetical protein
MLLMANGYKLRVNSPLSAELELLIQKVIGLAIEVHKTLGPGYIEIIYEKAFVLRIK